jgi:hypothetical protein
VNPVYEISTETLGLCDSSYSIDRNEELAAVRYIQVEFPSECWNIPHFATTVTGLLEEFFIKRLPVDPRIEHVYWDSEDDILKVWTVTSESDFSLEEPIYRAQMEFIEQFPTFVCDFSVIYRYGKALDEIAPCGAHLLR